MFSLQETYSLINTVDFDAFVPVLPEGYRNRLVFAVKFWGKKTVSYRYPYFKNLTAEKKLATYRSGKLSIEKILDLKNKSSPVGALMELKKEGLSTIMHCLEIKIVESHFFFFIQN